MQAFNAPMLSRNPVLHYVFARMEMAEERGLGLKSMKQKAEGAELPLPKYAWRDPYIELTLFRTREAATRTSTADVLASLSSSEQKGWQWLAMKGAASSSQYAGAMGFETRTA
jgi:ATP-dependent DNA helicase RecG